MDIYRHQRAYNERMEWLGYRRVTVWVPEDDVDWIKSYAEKLRIKYEEKEESRENFE